MNACVHQDQFDSVLACQRDAKNGGAVQAVNAAGRPAVNAYMADKTPSQCHVAPPPVPPRTSTPAPSQQSPTLTVRVTNDGGFDHTYDFFDTVCNVSRGRVTIASHGSASIPLVQ